MENGDTKKIIDKIDTVSTQIKDIDKRVVTLESDRDEAMKLHSKSFEQINELKHEVRTIKDNHLTHIQTSLDLAHSKLDKYDQTQNDHLLQASETKTNVEWLKKFLWAILAPALGGFIGVIWLVIRLGM